MKPITAYALSKKYVDETAEEFGGLKGASCQIQGMTPIEGGTRMTFLWVNTAGEQRTSTLDVMNGVDGTDGVDAVQIANITVNENNQILVEMADGTIYTTVTIPTVKGDDGVSPVAVAERVSDGAKITITDASGTTSAKAKDGVSPTVSVRRNSADNGVIIETTDVTGTHSATVNDGSVTATIDYGTGVLNKPKVNNVELTGNKTLPELGINIPTKNSQLLNDSGFITANQLPNVDTALSGVSENPVQNKAITSEIRSTQASINAVVTEVGANTAAIDILNGNATVNGSVDKKISDALANLDRLTKEIVTELPALADAVENVIYLVPSGQTYIQWTVVSDGAGGREWARLGSTDTDLTAYYNKTQVNELLDDKQATITGAATSIASLNLLANRVLVSDLNGKVGVSSTITANELDTLDGVTSNIQDQLDGKQGTLQYDNVPIQNSEKMLKSGAIYTALEAKQGLLTFDNVPTEDSPNPVKSGGVYTEFGKKQDVIQYSELPLPTAQNLGKIYQYTGDSTASYNSGSFYKVVLNPDTATYEYVETIAKTEVDDELSSTSENPVQNKVIKAALDDKQDELTVGKGITIEDDVISADTNLFSGTKEEYESLTEAEKKKYDYLASPETVDGELDVYSTSEVKTNKVWIDGKPIYRKVIHYAGVATSGTSTLIGSITGFADIISIEGTLRNSTDDNCFPLGYTYSNFGSTVIQNMPFVIGNNGSVYANPYGFNISNINVTIEYTKAD